MSFLVILSFALPLRAILVFSFIFLRVFVLTFTLIFLFTHISHIRRWIRSWLCTDHPWGNRQARTSSPDFPACFGNHGTYTPFSLWLLQLHQIFSCYATTDQNIVSTCSSFFSRNSKPNTTSNIVPPRNTFPISSNSCLLVPITLNTPISCLISAHRWICLLLSWISLALVVLRRYSANMWRV